jgi:uncharacterized membrane protein
MEDRGIKSHPLARRAVRTGQGVKVTRACTIRKPAAELFQFWRNLENLPHFMQHVIAVQKINDVESRWTVKAPGGRTVKWNAVIFNEEPNRLIAWRTREGADVPNAGSVRFEPQSDDTTIVKVALEYDPPGGKFAAFLSKLFGKEPNIQVAQDLARFKTLMETGEIPTTKGQPVGHAQLAKQRRETEEVVETRSATHTGRASVPASHEGLQHVDSSTVSANQQQPEQWSGQSVHQTADQPQQETQK